MTTITIIKLIASDGMMLTDGKHYGKEVFLGEKDSADNWYEITEEKAKELQEELLPEE